MNITNDLRQTWPMFLNLSSYTRAFSWLSATRPVLCTEKRMGKGPLIGPQMVTSPLVRCFIVMTLLTCSTIPEHPVKLASAALFLSNLNFWTVFLAVYSLADDLVTYPHVNAALELLIVVEWKVSYSYFSEMGAFLEM